MRKPLRCRTDRWRIWNIWKITLKITHGRETYMTKLNAVFDTEHAIEPENFVSLEEMFSHLKMK